MQSLPDTEVIVFLEWLNHFPFYNNQDEKIDKWDLLFNQEYYPLLYKIAEEYCFNSRQNASYTEYDSDQEFVKLFWAFRNSGYYLKCIKRNRQIQSENDYDHSIRSFLYYFRKFCFKSGYWREFGNSRVISDLSPQELISNTQTYLRTNVQCNSSETPHLSFMTMANPVEIDFLEWIGREYDHKRTYLKVDMMTVEQFEKLAIQYCIENKKENNVAKKLVRFFKETDSQRIINRLKSLLNCNNNKDIKYLIDRYCYEEERYKCMILTLENKENYKPYKELIKNYWSSLDNMSGESLDIYYSNNDYEKSGYEIAKSLTYANNNYNGRLPCIMLWKEKMEDAGFISIDKLDANDIFQVISFIVKSIEEKKELNNIVMEAEKMSKERNAKEINNTINNYGNMGSAVIGDNAKIRVDFSADGDNQFLNELNRAQEIISKNDELNDEQKKVLLDIFKEAKESVEENSAIKAETSKARFKAILAFIEDHGSKLIASLAGLATLASFFGIK